MVKNVWHTYKWTLFIKKKTSQVQQTSDYWTSLVFKWSVLAGTIQEKTDHLKTKLY
jgi:hypothetical protein